jgi:uncharacterized protein
MRREGVKRDTQHPVVKEALRARYRRQASLHACVRELSEKDITSTLRLLKEDPVRAVFLRGLLDDYGIRHEALRGKMFGYYEDDCLRNVAWLGHHILIYKDRDGLQEFAKTVAETVTNSYLIVGPEKQVEEFWSYLQTYGHKTRLRVPLFFYVCRKPPPVSYNPQLTLATLDQLDAITELQAELVREQSGEDPRVKDAEGFHTRVQDRILRQRTWVKMDKGQVIFKAELVHESPEAVYLESVWTHPDYRGRGIATTCLPELMNRFLFKKKAVCILVEPTGEAARRVYRRLGFSQEENYLGRYLSPLP